MSSPQPDLGFCAGAATMRSRIRELILQRRCDVLQQTTPDGLGTMGPRVAELNRLYLAIGDIPLDLNAGS